MKMHVLSGGRLRMRKSTFFPDADRNELFELPVSCILLRHPTGNVLFDTGCHPDVAVDPEGRWGGLTKLMTPIMGPDDNVLGSLKAIGVSPNDIDIVVCSHLHPDHCGCNQFFRKSTIYVHAHELAAAKAPEAEKSGYLASDFDNSVPLKVVEGETDLFGDDKIRLLPLPGHTPGTMGAFVTLDNSGAFLLAADSLSLRANLDRNIVPRNTWNQEACLMTFERIRQIEADGAKIICGHDDAQWSGLRKGADAYD